MGFIEHVQNVQKDHGKGSSYRKWNYMPPDLLEVIYISDSVFFYDLIAADFPSWLNFTFRK